MRTYTSYLKKYLEKALKLSYKALNYNANFVHLIQARDDVRKKLNSLKLSKLSDSDKIFDFDEIF